MDVNDHLREYAYCNAKDMTGHPSIGDDNELTQALGGYAEKQFKDRFGFDYHITPPDYPSNSDDLNAALSRQQLLQYSQDDPGHTNLSDLVKNYFSGVSIAEKIKGLVENDLETHLKSFAQDHIIGDWGIAVFDRTYKSDPGLNAVRASGIVLYFFRQEALTKTISSTYLYILGIFYEVVPLKPIIELDILNELTASVEDQIEVVSITNNPACEKLKIALADFAKQQFERFFAFEWDGESTEIPEGVSLNLAYSELLGFMDHPSDEQIEKRVGDMIFKRDGSEFPSRSVQAAIFDDLLNTIKYLTKPSDLPKDNSKWFEFSRERSFPIDPSKADSDFVKQYTIFVYTVGAKSGRDVHLRSDLTYYLTVFSKIPFPPLQ